MTLLFLFNLVASSPLTSPLGLCGSQNSAFVCDNSNCCSKWGYCGQGAEYCADGCQAGYGLCSGSSVPLVIQTGGSAPSVVGVTTNDRCGSLFNTRCSGTYCCSKYGYCGDTDAHCLPAQGCQISFGACTGQASSNPGVVGSGPANPPPQNNPPKTSPPPQTNPPKTNPPPQNNPPAQSSQCGLGVHNNARGNVGLAGLSWSSSLANDALAWAQHLESTNSFAHASQTAEGENLHWTSGTADCDSAVQSWLNERPNFIKYCGNGVINCNGGLGFESYGHFTQIMVQNLQSVGCAKTAHIVVCRYNRMQLTVNPETIEQPVEFHPQFTYPVFGDEEHVFGYKDLKIKLYYSSGSLIPYLSISSSSQIREGAKPQDILKILKPYIPKETLFNCDEFASKLRNEKFKPIGEKIHEYRIDSTVYEYYNQFLILPPHQGQGHGKTLYKYLYETFSSNPSVVDITVEDPNDSFQDMRDKQDVQMLLEHEALKDVTPKSFARNDLKGLMKQFHLCERQAIRCVEILFLKRVDRWDARQVKQYRIFVKKRLYKKNKEVLEGMEFGDRLNALEQTYDKIEQDYREIIKNLF
ncbi:histone acetyltransferase 1 [Terramyces sp. JEL0728]|nr:histone acetyltransferase 1 [Terramyces sp. JEL0728]